MVFILNNTKAVFHWSGGKDSALALYKVLQSPSFEVKELWTSLSAENERISMHGVRKSLLQKQAEQLEISLKEIFLKEGIKMSDYNAQMADNYRESKSKGLEHHFFGDIHLEDLKTYREKELQAQKLKGHFPLWQMDTKQVVSEFIELGFKAIVVCIDSRKLGKEFLGRQIDAEFLGDLPKDVDPCGENGEFHSFVYDGPLFKKPIDFQKGEVVFKEYKISKEIKDNCFKKELKTDVAGFWFCDLIEN